MRESLNNFYLGNPISKIKGRSNSKYNYKLFQKHYSSLLFKILCKSFPLFFFLLAFFYNSSHFKRFLFLLLFLIPFSHSKSLSHLLIFGSCLTSETMALRDPAAAAAWKYKPIQLVVPRMTLDPIQIDAFLGGGVRCFSLYLYVL